MGCDTPARIINRKIIEIFFFCISINTYLYCAFMVWIILYTLLTSKFYVDGLFIWNVEKNNMWRHRYYNQYICFVLCTYVQQHLLYKNFICTNLFTNQMSRLELIKHRCYLKILEKVDPSKTTKPKLISESCRLGLMKFVHEKCNISHDLCYRLKRCSILNTKTIGVIEIITSV